MKRNLLVALVALLMLGVPAVTYAQYVPQPPAKEEAKSAPDSALVPASVSEPKESVPVKSEEKKEVTPVKDAVPVPAPVTDDDIGKNMGLLVGAVQAGKWSVAVGLLLSLLIWIVRKVNIVNKLNKQAIPWVVAGVGILGFIAVALANGSDWMVAVRQGFVVGLQAVGLWEMILKRFLKPTEPATPDSVTSDPEQEPTTPEPTEQDPAISSQ